MKIIDSFKLLLIFGSLLTALPVHANKEALAKAKYMLRQMNAELNQLKVTNKKILAEKTQLESDNKYLQKKHDKLSSKSAKNKTAMKGKFADLKQVYKDEVLAHKETRQELNAITAEKNKMLDITTQQTQKIYLCVANNKKLFEINQLALTQYEEKGVWDSLTQGEPFSQLTQVEIENLIDDTQYKMDELRVEAGM